VRIDNRDPAWYSSWRRAEDESGRVVKESKAFEQFDHCIEDAQAHGLERADCLVVRTTADSQHVRESRP
jgi:hypothetical protein